MPKRLSLASQMAALTSAPTDAPRLRLYTRDSAKSVATPHSAKELERQKTNVLKATQRVVKEEGGHKLTHARRVSCRERVYDFVRSPRWVFFLLGASVVDVGVFVAEYLGVQVRFVLSLTGSVLLLFFIDLALRIYACRAMLCRRPERYFTVMDILVVLGSAVLWVAVCAARGYAPASLHAYVPRLMSSLELLATFIVVPQVLRLLRSLLLVRIVLQNAVRFARHETSGSKKRFLDLANGFDLDLTYVVTNSTGSTPGGGRLIAMSLPSTGLRMLYRNPLHEVARLLETRHGKQGYVIINCCPELPYRQYYKLFPSGTVREFDIQDHTPPTLGQCCDFLNIAAKELTTKCVAIHCKGGKGRTGTMCCAWMLYTRAERTAENALMQFALLRTELSQGVKKTQGVDTPSQQRYVGYICALLQMQNAYGVPNGKSKVLPQESVHEDPIRLVLEAESAPAALAWNAIGGKEVRPPARTPIVLQELVLDNWFAEAPKKACTLVCAVHTVRESSPIVRPCYVTAWSETQILPGKLSRPKLRFRFAVPPEVTGDVRISIFDLSKLRKAQKKLGKDKRLAFDVAADSPVAPKKRDGGAEEAPPTGLDGEHAKAKHSIAGTEPGCKFYFLFHTAFVRPAVANRTLSSDTSLAQILLEQGDPSTNADTPPGELHVLVSQMDKAFKNKKGKYNEAGVAKLRFGNGPAGNGRCSSVI